jgi:hypothetical protein
MAQKKARFETGLRKVPTISGEEMTHLRGEKTGWRLVGWCRRWFLYYAIRLIRIVIDITVRDIFYRTGRCDNDGCNL